MIPDKRVTSANDVPVAEHFAIFESDSYYTEGDERSRTYPGHGYSATTTNFIKYEAYFTEQRLLMAIKEKEESSYSRKSYKVCKIIPLTIQKTLAISVTQ